MYASYSFRIRLRSPAIQSPDLGTHHIGSAFLLSAITASKNHASLSQLGFRLDLFRNRQAEARRFRFALSVT